MLVAIVRALGQPIVAFMFLGLNMLICVPVIFGAAWLADRFETDPLLKVLGWAIRLLALALFLSSFYSANAAGRHMVAENRMFLESFTSAWLDVWRSLQWLPLIGHWFTPKRDPREALDDDEPGERPPPVT